MLTYKLEEELLFAKYYAAKLHDEKASLIFEKGFVNDAKEASHLSQFFWKMVDTAIEDEKNKTLLPWAESNQFLTEKLLQSISGYLDRAGFEKEWGEVSDQQDI